MLSIDAQDKQERCLVSQNLIQCGTLDSPWAGAGGHTVGTYSLWRSEWALWTLTGHRYGSVHVRIQWVAEARSK